MSARPITFLSDYGYEDEFAGVCRAVIARIAPHASLIDITHGIERHDVRRGGLALVNALPFAPPGVHLAVVDPEVGTERRAVAVRVAEEERVLVGPDNGLLWPAIERFGGPVEVVDVSRSRFRLEPVSATFHGRDVLAPVAAQLTLGATLADAGEPADPDSLARLDLPRPEISADRVAAHVISLDRFGNATLDLSHEHLRQGPLRLGEPLEVEVHGQRTPAIFARTFADVEDRQLLLYEDSTRSLALAVNRGDAAELLGLRPDDEIVLHPPR